MKRSARRPFRVTRRMRLQPKRLERETAKRAYRHKLRLRRQQTRHWPEGFATKLCVGEGGDGWRWWDVDADKAEATHGYRSLEACLEDARIVFRFLPEGG